MERKLTHLELSIDSNKRLLKQIATQLTQLQNFDESIYSAEIPIIGGASIGAHLRHILDFYSVLYFGFKKGFVDYDNRDRNPIIEQQLGAGIEHLSIAQEFIETFRHAEVSQVMVSASVDVNSNKTYIESNLIRELQTLHSHTTHHMAIIAIVLKLNQVMVSGDFGKAPSTITYEKQMHISGNPSVLIDRINDLVD